MPRFIENNSYTRRELQAALELLEDFLDSMPELCIDPEYEEEYNIMMDSFEGDDLAYILASFGSFLTNCINTEE